MRGLWKAPWEQVAGSSRRQTMYEKDVGILEPCHLDVLLLFHLEVGPVLL